ncbi:hypothetical protein Krac_8375 [Ktedonobacter racemifer DSM 44963]|uniref:Uncharacterized protein n=1 Tax=Ktedonobacter racemifer DSM 44963 TaxID=485913 RepID=D6TMQ4_KTERA|nr:hypothetical protein Krac_8375 [Ktedonobacter racemifer DSM 44963]
MKKLKEISTQLEVMRKNLANLMMTYQPDSKTLEFLNAQLQQLVE